MNLGLEEIRPAVVAVDLHRGHLDMSVATLPAPPEIAESVVKANINLNHGCRKLNIPIIHVVSQYRDPTETASNPFWKTKVDQAGDTRKNQFRHNLQGSPGTEIMPGLYAEGDLVIDTKKRKDCFYATDLEFALRARSVNTLLLTGVNTNSCVLCTAATANTLDYLPIIVEDCVGSMDGQSQHDAALLCIRTALGFVMPSEKVFTVLKDNGIT
ncbi:MAG: isochorismatase family cysteine hydrolase [Pseudomonadota bacterium]|nr:isochorismatase family cysteine hydrolase [Pseudomonadota bacterium]